ncbi:DUF2059 domain-containing protein [Psychrobacter phenylpyruvicus]|uniref:Uncharacterized protein conserved in bacteria n=1 Tax=Psychrobacter phenylpyruvicus TaxID=29432 RepID=A0A379LP39_9GAMM|nr:DUF2059 domain-containing protein [Psychrobacter phenylpyruvicus]SUD92313.1 Uncharacterized protein conserved in bacteria [Psychrobacter phenylpyruvicus]
MSLLTKTCQYLFLSATLVVSGLSITQVSHAAVAFQAQDSQKVALARKLINMDGSKQGFKQANKFIIESMRSNMIDMPDEFLDKLSKKMDSYDYEAQLASTYAQVLSTDELNALIELYNSPTGKSLANKMGLLTERIALQQSQISEQMIQQTLAEMGMLD